jgi:hypothetical protein
VNKSMFRAVISVIPKFLDEVIAKLSKDPRVDTIEELLHGSPSGHFKILHVGLTYVQRTAAVRWGRRNRGKLREMIGNIRVSQIKKHK